MEALGLDHHKLLSALPGNHLIIQVAAGNYKVVAVSRGYSRISSLSLPYQHMSLSEFLGGHTVLLGTMRAALDRVLSTGLPYEVREAHRVGGHEKEWILGYTPMAGDDGTVEYVMHSVTEAGSRAPRYEGHPALEAAGVGLFDYAASDDLVNGSPRFFEIFGIEPGAHPYSVLRAGIHEEDRHLYDQAHDEALRSGMLFYEARLAGEPDACRWVRVSATCEIDSTGKLARIQGTALDLTAEKTAQRNFEKSELRLHLATESAELGTFELDLATNALTYSERYLQIMGQDPGTRWNLTRFLGQVHPDDLNLVKQLFEEIYNASSITCEIRMIYPDQSVNWIRKNVKVLYNAQQEPVQMIGTVMNVTNQRLTRDALERKVIRRTIELEEKNEELRRQKDFANALLDASVDVIAVFDMEERFIISNRRHQEVYNVQPAQIIGRTLAEAFPEAKNSFMHHGLQRAMKGETYHLPVYRSKITGRYSELFCVPLKQNETVYAVMAIAHDNSEIISYSEQIERKNYELVQSEERYHRMVNEVEDYAIILLDAEGRIQNWNRGAEKIKGYTEAQILGKSFKLFYGEEDLRDGLPDRLLAQAVREGRAANEGWRLRCDGSKFWALVVITALHNEAREIIGFSKVTRDLTEKKQIEDHMLRTQQHLEQSNQELIRSNQELASFSYVASHDLQEPLRKIHTFANYISQMEVENLSDTGKAYFERMQVSIQRMQLLIRDLLAYSRLNTTGQGFEKTDLNQMMAEIVNDLNERMQEREALFESVELPTLSVIPFQFKQLFTNLLINALKFSREGVPSRIRLSTSLVSGKELKDKLDRRPAKQYIGLHLSDNGIGFEQEYALKIFQIFQRLHGKSEYPGTGIGLAICQRIVQNHHGCITAEGRLGEGATFSVYMPLDESGSQLTLALPGENQ